MLGVNTVASDSGFDLLVDHHIDLHSGLGHTLENLVQTPFLVVVWGAPKKKLGTKPPIFNVDGLFGSFQCYRHGIKVVLTVNVPFDQVPFSFGSERLKAVAITDFGPLLVCCLFMRLIMAMIGIYKIAQFSNLMFQVDRFHLGIVQMGFLDISKAHKGILATRYL